MRFGSVCSGVECASVAWHWLGWRPAWVAEQVELGVVEAPDILVGGTPCQGFSLAGLRGGLDDARSQLALSFVEIANAIDSARVAAGDEPCIAVWENVLGVLSIADNSFGNFLAALAGEDCALEPPGKKWSNAGVVVGPQRTIAWRVIDAQWFGLAQRRKRVYLVASARDGFDPGEILLEFDGVRRDSAPSREAGQSVAEVATDGTGSRGIFTPSSFGAYSSSSSGTLRANGGDYGGGSETIVAGHTGSRSHWDGDEHPHPTLNQSASGSGGIGSSNQEIFSQRGAYLVPGNRITNRLIPDTVGTLDTECGFNKATMQTVNAGHLMPCVRDAEGAHTRAFGDYIFDETASTIKARDYKDATDLVIGPIECVTEPVTHCLKAEGFDASEDGTGRGQPIVPVAYRTSGNCGAWETGDRTDALTTTTTDPTSHVIAFSVKDYGGDASENLSPTSRSGNHNQSHANGGVMSAIAYAIQGAATRLNPASGPDGKGWRDDGVAYTLEARSEVQCVAFNTTQLTSPYNRSDPKLGDPCHTLAAGDHPPAMAYGFQPRIGRNGRGDMGDVVNALTAQAGETGKGDAGRCVAFSVMPMNSGKDFKGRETDIAQPLMAAGPGMGNQGGDYLVQNLAVRRLLPEECEALQGFPRNWTRIPVRFYVERKITKLRPEDMWEPGVDENGKPGWWLMSADGPRYKQMGNSMASHCMAWVGARIRDWLNLEPYRELIG